MASDKHSISQFIPASLPFIHLRDPPRFAQLFHILFMSLITFKYNMVNENKIKKSLI